MEFSKSKKYDRNYVLENCMGPNPMKILEELAQKIPLKDGLRVLDLGCGRGLTSIFLAKEFHTQVFAVDLWTPATENYQRFREAGLEDRIIPLHANSNDLPFADEFFDAVISVDSYHYFGRDERFFGEKLLPLVKRGGVAALAIPGMKTELHGNIPQEMLLSWTAEDLDTIQTCAWWENLLRKTSQGCELHVSEMDCYEEVWQDWLACDNDYARNDSKAMNAGAGRYMNMISVIADKK